MSGENMDDLNKLQAQLQNHTVCAVTNVPYVIINGKMYILRENLSSGPLSYIPRDFISRIGQDEGVSYYELEYGDRSQDNS